MVSITVTGNVGKDPILRTVGSDQVLSFSVASSRKIKGEEHTFWFDCSVWGKRAEPLSSILAKGSAVTVVGEFSTREHDGRTYLRVRVGEIEVHGSRNGGQAAPRAQQREAYSYGPDGGSDDLPF